MKKYILILLMAALMPVFGARAVCDGRVREDNPGWRYMDSDFFGRIQTEKCSDGSVAAVLNPLMGKARFIFHIANITAEPEITKDMGLRIVFRYTGIKTPPPLRIQLSYDKPDWSPKGKLSDSVKADDYATGTEWRTAEVPLTAFPEAVGHKLKRVQVFPEHNIDMPPDGKLLIREISVVRDPKFAAAKIILQETADSKTGAAARKPRYCAVFPKPFWYTGKDSFYADDVYRDLHEQGFNVIGSPGMGTSSPPSLLSERLEMFRGTCKKATSYPGMRIYPKMTMCWHFPENGEHFSKMVWFNGFEQELVCPVDENYWNERVLPYMLAFAEASKEFDVFAIMMDWEIYADNSKTRKFRNVYGVCHCDNCWKRFGNNLPDIPRDQRNQYLTEHKLRVAYNRAFYQRLSELAGKLRSETDKINPKLSYWLLPTIQGDFLTTVGKALATPEAPLVVTNEDTYGKPSLAVSDCDAVESNVAKCKDDLQYLEQHKIPYIYLAAIMGDLDPRYHGKQAIEMGKVCDGIWLWELSKVDHYKYGRDNLMKILTVANREIREGTFNIPPEWKQDDQQHREAVPAGKTGVGLSGLNAADIPLPETAHSYEVKNLSPENLGDTRLLILQNFNVQLSGDSAVVKGLRQYVYNGGRLFLTHDTGFFMASPFPEIVKGHFLPPEIGDPRHILDTRLKVTAGPLAGRDITASFNDHLVFTPGPQGTVIAEDKYGYPVIVTGIFGKGKVIYSGCYYRKLEQNSPEWALTRSLVQWLLE